MDADAILEVLLMNATRTLSLLRDEDGIPLRHIKKRDIVSALEMIGLPNEFTHAAGELIQQRFRNCDLTHRQLASFLRFGRAPGNSLNLPPKARPVEYKKTREVHENVVAAYNQASEADKRAARKLAQSSLPAVRLAARAEASGAEMGPSASAPSAANYAAPDVSAHIEGKRRGAGRVVPASKSAPVLPTLARKRRLGSKPPGALPPISPPAAVPSRRPNPSFSFGKAERFRIAPHNARMDYAARLEAAEQLLLQTGPQRQRHVFGAASEHTRELGEEAQLVLSSLQARWHEGKAKMAHLIARLDRDGDGELERSELRVALQEAADDEASEGSQVSSEAIDQILYAFDRDGSGSISAHELKRALCGSHELLMGKMRAGGLGEMNVTAVAGRIALRQGVDTVFMTGQRMSALRGPDGELPGEEDLRELMREALVRHSSRIVELYEHKGDVLLMLPVFVSTVADVFGLHAVDVGAEAAHSLQKAVADIFRDWDIAGLGMTVTEVNKILHKGGRITIPQRVKKDAIFQTELRTGPAASAAASSSPRNAGRFRDRNAILSEARQALHGFTIQTREEQLRKRAAKVAPVQLEALMHAMVAEANTVLDIFLKWDADGNGVVSSSEFAAAICKLGFRFSKEVSDELFAFFDKDDSDAVSIEELEATLKWGKERKQQRPLLAGWRQLSLSLDDDVPVHEQLRLKLREQGKHPKSMFKRWDDDGNGTLDKAELGELMETLGGMDLSPGELDKLFDSFDVDSSGTISFKELTAKLRKEVPIEQLMNALVEPNAKGKLWDMFNNKWDKDGDGLLDIDEFTEVLKELQITLKDASTVKDLFNMLDEDGSGSISLKELQNSLRWISSCEKCMELRNEAFTFDGTLTIQTQIRRALAINSVRVMDLFREWDENGDGKLQEIEFLRAMPLLGIHASKAEVEGLFRSIDLDGDGWITFKEFNRVLRKENEEMANDHIRDPFGREVQSNWRPPSPSVAVVDLRSLRNIVKTENKLRGLESVKLKPLSNGQPKPAAGT